MLVALTDDDWSDDLLETFMVPREILPEIRECDALRSSLRLAGRDLPLLASGFDMGLALLGHACLSSGETKATFGTCLGVMTATAGEAHALGELLTTIPYTRNGSRAYALDGEIAAAGALVEWAVSVGIAGSATELEALAASASPTSGVVVVPAISGLGAPHWRDSVRGAIVGITAGGRPAGAGTRGH